MKQDEIIEMALQCGFVIDLNEICISSAPEPDPYTSVEDELTRFAKLVAAKEREACAKRASVALLGTLKTTSDRVLAAIRARGEA